MDKDMEKLFKLIQMDKNMKDNTLMIKNKEKEFIF